MRQYQIFELTFQGEAPAGSHVQVELYGEFALAGETTTAKGFYAGDGTYLIRYYPGKTGICTWKIRSGLKLVGQMEGEELCVAGENERTESYHGMVRAKGLHFQYDDGTRYVPVGTTVYALLHQKEERIDRTMKSLSDSPFNKVRLCLFPKDYDYNHNEPDDFAFERGEDGEWDVHRPDFGFWNRLEQRIMELGGMGIEADLILFHGYDRWGFSRLSREQCLVCLDYVLRRLGAFPNVWWSLANEYEILKAFEPQWWRDFAEYIGKNDAYGHLLSCHNFLALWDFDNPNVSHCSIQDVNVIRVPDLQKRYRKPVIFDECCYEGNLPYAWGNLSAFELVNRFWAAAVMGGYCTHGETYLAEDEVLWWAKGGTLKGESVQRIAFLRSILEELPGNLDYVDGPYEMLLQNPEEIVNVPEGMREMAGGVLALLQSLPEQRVTDFFDQNRLPLGRCKEEAYLMYLGRQCAAETVFALPTVRKYRIELIDIWEMTRTTVLEEACGEIKVMLPGKEGIAVLALAHQSKSVPLVTNPVIAAKSGRCYS